MWFEKGCVEIAEVASHSDSWLRIKSNVQISHQPTKLNITLWYTVKIHNGPS